MDVHYVVVAVVRLFFVASLLRRFGFEWTKMRANYRNWCKMPRNRTAATEKRGQRVDFESIWRNTCGCGNRAHHNQRTELTGYHYNPSWLNFVSPSPIIISFHRGSAKLMSKYIIRIDICTQIDFDWLSVSARTYFYLSFALWIPCPAVKLNFFDFSPTHTFAYSDAFKAIKAHPFFLDLNFHQNTQVVIRCEGGFVFYYSLFLRMSFPNEPFLKTYFEENQNGSAPMIRLKRIRKFCRNVCQAYLELLAVLRFGTPHSIASSLTLKRQWLAYSKLYLID